MTTSTALSPASVYQLLRGAGYSRQAAITQTAIGMAESTLHPDAVGDVKLQDATWGPSVGLFQERTLKAAPGQPGYNRFRDPANLKTPQQQAAAAYATSSGGRNFTPWSTFTSGAYIKYLPTVARSITGLPDTPDATAPATGSSTSSGALTVQPAGFNFNPLDGFGLFSSAAGDLKAFLFVGAGLALAVGLFGLGAFQASQPARDAVRPVVQKAQQAAKTAGEAAAVAG